MGAACAWWQQPGVGASEVFTKKSCWWGFGSTRSLQKMTKSEVRALLNLLTETWRRIDARTHGRALSELLWDKELWSRVFWNQCMGMILFDLLKTLQAMFGIACIWLMWVRDDRLLYSKNCIAEQQRHWPGFDSPKDNKLQKLGNLIDVLSAEKNFQIFLAL